MRPDREIRWKASVGPLGRCGEWFVVDWKLKVVAPSVSVKARPLSAPWTSIEHTSHIPSHGTGKLSNKEIAVSKSTSLPHGWD